MRIHFLVVINPPISVLMFVRIFAPHLFIFDSEISFALLCAVCFAMIQIYCRHYSLLCALMTSNAIFSMREYILSAYVQLQCFGPPQTLTIQYSSILTAVFALVQAQNLALNKTVIVSSQGGNINSHPPSAANDGDTSSSFFTKDLPWSFVAIDLGALFEIDRISFKTQTTMRKLKSLFVRCGSSSFDFCKAFDWIYNDIFLPN